VCSMQWNAAPPYDGWHHYRLEAALIVCHVCCKPWCECVYIILGYADGQGNIKTVEGRTCMWCTINSRFKGCMVLCDVLLMNVVTRNKPLTILVDLDLGIQLLFIRMFSSASVITDGTAIANLAGVLHQINQSIITVNLSTWSITHM